MNVRLLVTSIWLPALVRRRKIEELFSLTAGAFGESAPAKDGSSGDLSLENYAVFTRKLVDSSTANGKDLAAVRAALRREALAFGERMRRQFRVRSRNDALELVVFAYKTIGIALDADAEGRITVNRCFFSRHYTPETCRIVAALDEGLMSGILGEGNLEFGERITEGQSRCRAVFRSRGRERE